MPTPAARSFHAFGTTFAVTGDDAQLVDTLSALAPDLGWTPTGAASPTEPDVTYTCAHVNDHVEIVSNDGVVCRTARRSELMDRFESHAKIETALRAKNVVFVHAGVVCVDGRAIVLPGKS